MGNGELPGGEFCARFEKWNRTLRHSSKKNKCRNLINPYSVAFFVCFYFQKIEKKITNHFIPLSNTVVQNFNSVVGNGELAH